jgi:hypothetical protein
VLDDVVVDGDDLGVVGQHAGFPSGTTGTQALTPDVE